MVPLRHDRRRRLRRTRGFTLVELITAASLMTLMMTGVVQIFAIITETASQAQGNAYALEQGRAILDTIHRDIRGFDRNGYFKIRKSDTNDAGIPSTYADPGVPTVRPTFGVPIMSGVNTIRWYASDCLALTTVGCMEGQKGGSTARTATGAEVLYTPNVLTPTARFAVVGSAQNVDPRRGLVARSAWLVGGSTGVGTTGDETDGSRALTMADLAYGLANDRISLFPGSSGVPSVQVAPLSTAEGWTITPGSAWQTRRVATCCTSEFLIEAFDETTIPKSFPILRKDYTVVPITLNSPLTGTSSECPRAIRVTVAIHDPSDKRPMTGPSKRYEGFALQEVFWISDP